MTLRSYWFTFIVTSVNWVKSVPVPWFIMAAQNKYKETNFVRPLSRCVFNKRHRCLSNVDFGKRQKNLCQHVSAQRGVIEKLKMNPFCAHSHTHTHTHTHTHSHPLPAAPASLPQFSWVSEWEIKFFWWESFSCPHSTPPSLSSHPFFNLFAYLWTINLCTEREINSCAVKCSGCCHAHNRWSSPRDWHESHTHCAQKHMTPYTNSKGKARQVLHINQSQNNCPEVLHRKQPTCIGF